MPIWPMTYHIHTSRSQSSVSLDVIAQSNTEGRRHLLLDRQLAVLARIEGSDASLRLSYLIKTLL